MEKSIILSTEDNRLVQQENNSIYLHAPIINEGVFCPPIILNMGKTTCLNTTVFLKKLPIGCVGLISIYPSKKNIAIESYVITSLLYKENDNQCIQLQISNYTNSMVTIMPGELLCELIPIFNTNDALSVKIISNNITI